MSVDRCHCGLRLAELFLIFLFLSSVWRLQAVFLYKVYKFVACLGVVCCEPVWPSGKARSKNIKGSK